MRLGPVDFTPRLLPTIAAILAVALTASLGRWQMNRAEEKRGRERQYTAMQMAPPLALSGHESGAASLQFRQLTAQGEFEGDKQIFIDNQVENAQAGYQVLAPLKLDDGQHYILVNRGWVARSADYPAPPKAPVPSGRIQVQGYGALPVKRFLELSSNTVQGSVWQNLTFERYRQATGLPLLPVILVQTEANTKGLIPVRSHADFGTSMHEGYAFQWFALSAAIVATYLLVNTRYAKR